MNEQMTKGSVVIDSAPANPNVVETNLLPASSETITQKSPPKVNNNAYVLECSIVLHQLILNQIKVVCNSNAFFFVVIGNWTVDLQKCRRIEPQSP